MRNTRPINWVKGALRDFQRFPDTAQGKAVEALTIVADGATPGIATPKAKIDLVAERIKRLKEELKR